MFALRLHVSITTGAIARPTTSTTARWWIGSGAVSPHDHSRTHAGVRVVLDHHDSVHNHGGESGGISMRRVEGRVFLHRRGIENHQIGPVAFPYLAPVLDAKGRGRE